MAWHLTFFLGCQLAIANRYTLTADMIAQWALRFPFSTTFIGFLATVMSEFFLKRTRWAVEMTDNLPKGNTDALQNRHKSYSSHGPELYKVNGRRAQVSAVARAHRSR